MFIVQAIKAHCEKTQFVMCVICWKMFRYLTDVREMLTLSVNL